MNQSSEGRKNFFSDIREHSNPERHQVFVHSRMLRFLPEDFFENPLAFIEHHGMKLKRTGDDLKDEHKVFELSFENRKEKFNVIAKFPDLSKNRVRNIQGREVVDPLLELKILNYLDRCGLPGAKPLGYVRLDNQFIILYQKLRGMHFYDDLDRNGDLKKIWDKFGAKNILGQIEEQMLSLKPRYENVGINRVSYRPMTCLFRIGGDGVVSKVVPIDWEETSIQWGKLIHPIKLNEPNIT